MPFLQYLPEFALENKYSLKRAMVENEYKIKDHVIICPIQYFTSSSSVYITSSAVLFYFYLDEGITFQISCDYEADRIINVSENFRVYLDEEDCWQERYDYKENVCLNSLRKCVRGMFKASFKQITVRYRKDEPDMVERPWFYENMCSFEQRISLATLTRLSRFFISFRKELFCKQRYKKHYYNCLMLRGLIAWREWYYDPSNYTGYVKKMRNYSF